MRHGEASDEASSDKLRQLTEVGRKQAEIAVFLLNQQCIKPQIIVSSDALRAKETATIVSEGIEGKRPNVTVQPWIYDDFTTQEFIDNIVKIMTQVPESNTMMVVGHNPLLSYRTSSLLKRPESIYYPPAGFVALTFDCERWEDIEARSGNVLFSSFF